MSPLDPARSLGALELSLARVRRLYDSPAGRDPSPVPSISAWSVPEQLSHLVLACDLSLRNATSLARDSGRLVREPVDRKDEALAMLAHGLIPRGVAPAPRFVTPPKAIDRDVLGQLLGEVEEARRALAADLPALRAAPRTIPHQLLGDLTAAEWLRFARVHTTHHLRICRDILRVG